MGGGPQTQKQRKKKWAPHGSMELSTYSHEKQKGRKKKNKSEGKKKTQRWKGRGGA